MEIVLLFEIFTVVWLQILCMICEIVYSSLGSVYQGSQTCVPQGVEVCRFIPCGLHTELIQIIDCVEDF